MRELKYEIGEEIKECQIFNPPRRLFCWNKLEVPVERDVTAVALCYYGYVAVTFDGEMFSHCATIGKSKDLKETDSMSELKAFDVVLGRYCGNGSPCIVAIDANRNPRVLDEKVYLKSEADKVIADLEESHKKEVEQLLMEIVKLKEFSVQCQRAARTLRRKLRHANHKRCLWVAKWCGLAKEFRDTSWYEKWINKWNDKWWKLAEKFKEAK